MEQNLHRQNDTELSMRHAIHSLKQKVDSLTRQLERSKQKQQKFVKLSTDRNREAKRLRAHNEWLQKRCNNLIDFIRENGLKPPIDNNDSEKG